MAGLESFVNGIAELIVVFEKVASDIEDVVDGLGDSFSGNGLWPVPPESVHKTDELQWPMVESRPKPVVRPVFIGHPVPLGGDL